MGFITGQSTLSSFYFWHKLLQYQFPSLSPCACLYLSFSGLLRTVPPFSRPLLLSVAKEILVKRGKEDDESIHSFVSRRLGKEVQAERSLFTFFLNYCDIQL